MYISLDIFISIFFCMFIINDLRLFPTSQVLAIRQTYVSWACFIHFSKKQWVTITKEFFLMHWRTISSQVWTQNCSVFHISFAAVLFYSFHIAFSHDIWFDYSSIKRAICKAEKWRAVPGKLVYLLVQQSILRADLLGKLTINWKGRLRS